METETNHAAGKSQGKSVKLEVKTEFKQEPFEVFEAREQVGINIITNENFNPWFRWNDWA